MKQTTVKHWIYSSLHTFLTGFILAILPFVDTIDLKHIDRAVIIGIIGAGLRAGIKGVGIILSAPVLPKEE